MLKEAKNKRTDRVFLYSHVFQEQSKSVHGDRYENSD